MPCDTITTTQLDLSKASADVLSAALVSLGLKLTVNTATKIVATSYQTTVTWERGKGMTVRTNDDSLADKIQQAYASTTLQIVAKKNGWLIKQTEQNKFQVIRR